MFIEYDLLDREADHIAFGVHLLHDLIVGSLPEIAWPLIEEHLEIVALGVVPNLHSVSGHSLHPRFTLSALKYFAPVSRSYR